jgi:hypothetical protein
MISAVVALILLLRPLVLLGLRAAVRSRDFWKNTLQQAYYDKTKVGGGEGGWGLGHRGADPVLCTRTGPTSRVRASICRMGPMLTGQRAAPPVRPR